MAGEDSRPLPSFPEVELEELQWQRQAPYIEPTSYLVKDDGSGYLNAVGKEVVFIKEGYFEQCKAVQQQPVDPRWSSIHLRRWQSVWLSESLGSQQRDGIGHCKLGLVERCKVLQTTFYCRKLPEKAEGPQSVLEGSEGVWDAPAEQPNTEVPPSEDQLPEHRATPPNSGSEDDEDDEEEEEEGNIGRYFVRVTLQRLPQENDRLGPVCTVIDHYLDSGVGEWIIPRERYDSTKERRWKRGDRIQMYWADQASSGRGQWWEGTVLGHVKRRAEDPFCNSPWAAVTIKWSETGSTDNISPWELSVPEDDIVYRDSSGSEMESDWEAAETHNETEDEDWELLRSGGTLQRSNRRYKREESPRSEDSASSLDYEPSRKRHRGSSNSRDVPETMLPRKSKGTVDWNKGHCAICKSRPDGSLVVECDGTCLRSFHARCLSEDLRPSEDDEADVPWFCADCRAGKAHCAMCGSIGLAGIDVLKCKLGGCGNYFHPECLRQLATTNACLKIHKDSGEASTSGGRSLLLFTCPSHYCDRCHLSGDSLKIYRCWTCLKAVHGKCMDRTEARLNEREMECRDCAAATGTCATSDELPGPSNAADTVPVWQPEKASSQPQPPKVTKWTASLTDTKTSKRKDLIGKAIFHFGSHRKGGGCDFFVPVQNVKFHSELKILPDGNVVLAYCHNKVNKILWMTMVQQKEGCQIAIPSPYC